MENVMPENEIKLLDHGYIKLIETWGSDERIIEAARMSTGKGFLGWGEEETCDKCGGSGTNEPENGPGSLCKQCRGRKVFVNKAGDEKLLRYLYENRHDTPFEMAGMIVEVQAPIIVFREWHRHRVPWSYNEASARYAPLPALDFLPTVERLMRGGGHLTKQAAAHGDKVLTEEKALQFRCRLEAWQRSGEQIYQDALEDGVPKELARGAMSVFRYSKMRASANLRGWLHLFGLRMKPNAQEEFRVYAQAAGDPLIKMAFPRTWQLFAEKSGLA